MEGNRSSARVGSPEVHINDHFSAHLQSVYPGVDASHASPYTYVTAVLVRDVCVTSTAAVGSSDCAREGMQLQGATGVPVTHLAVS